MSEAFKTWQCRTCGWIYEEEKGAPEEGIPPGTRWQDVAASFRCPLCGTVKKMFDMVEV